MRHVRVNRCLKVAGARSRGANGGPRPWRQFNPFDRVVDCIFPRALSLAARSFCWANT